MKQPSLIKLASLALATILSSALARADVPIYQDKISIYGYAAGSLAFQESKYLHGLPNDTDSPLGLDAAKLGAAFNFDPVTAKLSFYVPSSRLDSQQNPDSIYLLEANATYALKSGDKFTFGRFQSFIGYEPFDIPNGAFITAGADGGATNAPGLNIVPNFHEGLKYEGSTGNFAYGLALLDSIYNKAGGKPYRGDGSLSDGFGFEAFGNYHGDNLSGQLTIGFQNNRTTLNVPALFFYANSPVGNSTYALNFSTDTWVVDLYGEYKVPNSKVTLGLEGSWRSDDPNVSLNSQVITIDDQQYTLSAQNLSVYNSRVNTYFGLAMMKYQFTEPFYLAFRFSFGKKQATLNSGQTEYLDPTTGSTGFIRSDGVMALYYKYTAAASYTFSKNVEVRAEASATDYMKTNVPADTKHRQLSDAYYAGVQLILKF